MKFYEAKAYCLGSGMRLSVPEDVEMNSILAALTPIMGDVWLGAHRSPSDFNRWEDEVLSTPIGYSNWAWGEPNNYQIRHETVAKLRCDSAWNDITIDEEYAVICTREIDI